MDIERLKKINKLSVELKKHGMAESSMDAVKQAEDYIPEKEMKRVMQETREFSENINNSSTSEQYQILLERQNRKVGQELQRLNEVMMQLNTEIEMMKSQICQLKKTSVSTVTEKVEKQVELKTEEKKENPRHGKYTPEDVAVEKMFYYGKK